MRFSTAKTQNNSKTKACIKLKLKGRMVTPSGYISKTEWIHHFTIKEILSHFFLSLSTVRCSFNVFDITDRSEHFVLNQTKRSFSFKALVGLFFI